MDSIFRGCGFYPADILVPRGCDMTKWSVVACDQYTSQPEYWSEVEKEVGDAPSALKLMLPEIHLGSADEKQRIAAIRRHMQNYLDGGVFRQMEDSLVYVERTLSDGRTRRGLVGAVDLEDYDYHAGASSLIRATEGTVLERIPPRVRVREGAPLEMPHVMVLIDDPGRTVIERAARDREEFEPLYDFDLMQGGGHIAGWRVCGEFLAPVAQALRVLTSPEEFARKYGAAGKPVMAYAMGDGNHSLATAKRCYERLKAKLPPRQAARHPARYALVELVNLHDDSLDFEPIHRVAFDIDPEKLLRAFFDFYPQAKGGEGPGHRMEYVHAGGGGVLSCACPETALAVGCLQNFLDDYIARNGGRVDYIHGDDVARELGRRPGSIAFLLPAMGKGELFPSVIADGVLPRKTFSMGNAQDKRFYLECRRIG